MTIHLPESLERYVHEQVQAGHYPTEDAVIRDALERHRRSQEGPDAGGAATEDDRQALQRRLLDAGIINEIKPPITDPAPYRDRRAARIQGEPISETAIRERR